ncbi:replicative DNA helicase [Proteinivorax tanatarense]|uniref:Replicative DNA helicase n=1 Tax=Proteinivorax tanatarense TaxID=1260629 RepID=A0AAU7VMJ9_9FIRM
MDLDIKTITENYRERVQRIALFDCLYKLQSKKRKDNSQKEIDFFGLGILTLLFFFENMLIRNNKTGSDELADFFYKVNDGEIDLDKEGFEKIAREIIEIFRPPRGTRNSRSFYNWQDRQQQTVEYSILQAGRSDIKTNKQYYKLDDDGLELIFATKEYFSEFQLSISQLLLRKQLEKGEFVSALRQIDEMRIAVESLEERIVKIKQEVQRNILDEKTYKRYKELVEDINNRLTRESDEFEELKGFVKEARDTLFYEIKNEKDERAYKFMVKIQQELEQVHSFHTVLLQKSVELKTTTLQSAQESLYYVGVDSFNFKQELVSRMFSSPLPLESSKTLAKPFLYLQHNKTWSPLSVFAPQRITNREQENKSSEFMNMKAEDERQKELKAQQQNLRFIGEIVLKAMDGENEITLAKVVDYMDKNNYENILSQPLFAHFFIMLHQKSPLALDNNSYEKEKMLKEVIALLKTRYQRLSVREIPKKLIIVRDRFKMQDMAIRLEERNFGL